MDIRVAMDARGDTSSGPDAATAWTLTWNDGVVPCAVGRSGLSVEKREGDGATPIGCFALRRVLYRTDRLDAPGTALPSAPIGRDSGWCDDPESGEYNCLVRLPFDASAERLWRDDGIYDVIVVLGHNDSPPRPGKGSAIFLHVARSGYGPTEGCVALALGDLLRLLGDCTGDDRLCIGSAGDEDTAGPPP